MITRQSNDRLIADVIKEITKEIRMDQVFWETQIFAGKKKSRSYPFGITRHAAAHTSFHSIIAIEILGIGIFRVHNSLQSTNRMLVAIAHQLSEQLRRVAGNFWSKSWGTLFPRRAFSVGSERS